jgi:VanZ family protein
LELQSAESQAARPRLLRAWWPAAAWIGLIGLESTDYLSSENTGNLLFGLLTGVFGQIDIHNFQIWHHYLRKTGHVVGYGILSLLLLRAWRATLARTRGWNWRPAILAWLVTAAVAAMDEWHQTFIPSRTGTIWDVALDSVAGLGFLLAAWFWLRRSSSALGPP